MVDTNMETALQWANELGSSPMLPVSLENVDLRARLVNAIDTPLVYKEVILERLNPQEKSLRMNNFAKTAAPYMQEIDDASVRLNIVLRLYSGCLSAAKAIALQTNDGPNTPERRAEQAVTVDFIAQSDMIYSAGAEAAPSFKRLRREAFSLDGIPKNSVIRKRFERMAKGQTL